MLALLWLAPLSTWNGSFLLFPLFLPPPIWLCRLRRRGISHPPRLLRRVTTSWVFDCCVLFFNQTAPALPVSTSPCIAGAPWSSAAHAPTASASSQRSHCRRPQVLATETAITKRTNAANQACRGATGYDVRAHTHMDAETHHTPHTSITAVRAFHAPGGDARPRVIYPV